MRKTLMAISGEDAAYKVRRIDWLVTKSWCACSATTSLQWRSTGCGLISARLWTGCIKSQKTIPTNLWNKSFYIYVLGTRWIWGLRILRQICKLIAHILDLSRFYKLCNLCEIHAMFVSFAPFCKFCVTHCSRTFRSFRIFLRCRICTPFCELQLKFAKFVKCAKYVKSRQCLYTFTWCTVCAYLCDHGLVFSGRILNRQGSRGSC